VFLANYAKFVLENCSFVGKRAFSAFLVFFETLRKNGSNDFPEILPKYVKINHPID
jgi:hypothetical protein